MKHSSRIFVVMAILLFAGGCAYYNTFFNAEKYFANANKMPLLDNGRPNPNAVRDYNKAIKKCGIILTEYKDTKYADDALFLLAKCFYFTGTNYTLAMEKFDDLIRFYPESEFVPEAMLYKARCKQGFNKHEEAYRMLRDFIADDTYSDYHPQALNLLAHYYLDEENFVQAAYYFDKIINDYPESKEYEDAYFLRGKALHIYGLYRDSNEVFFQLLNSRISKKTKLDARYYIAYNYLELGEYAKAEKYIQRLLKQEYRTHLFSKIELLLARSYRGMGKITEAEELFESVINNNRRRLIASEAAFYLSEMYFDVHDYKKAIENYKRVKQENKKSPFIARSLTKSAVASQIIQYYNPDNTMDVQDLVQEQFKLAEYYIEILDTPDSALVVYQKIYTQRQQLASRIDSLSSRLVLLQDSLASITPAVDSSRTVTVADSTVSTVPDSSTIAKAVTADDSIIARADTLALADSTLAENTPAAPDSAAIAMQNKREALASNITETTASLTKAQQDITLFDEEFIPFSKMVKVWLYANVYRDSAKADSIYREMYRTMPDNKHTFAAERYLAGKEVELITRQTYLQREEYKDAIGMLDTSVDSTIARLQNIATKPDHHYYPLAMYSLGHLYYFDKQDSTTARPYLDELLAIPTLDSQLRSAASAFYTGKHFVRYQRLPALITLEEQQRAAEAETERLRKEAEEAAAAEAQKQDQTSDLPDDQQKTDDSSSQAPAQTDILESVSDQ